MRPRALAGAFLVAIALALVHAGVASAAPKRVSGELSRSGYTVIALASNGKARSVRVRRRAFRLIPPARLVTLHLRAPDGSYAGPIVVRRRGKRAIVGVRHGAKLGKVRIRKGYARTARTLPRRRAWLSRWARTRRGAPLGARSFGLVRSRSRRAGGPGRDRDLDGLPGAFDIDDDGDRVLDSLERPRKLKAKKSARAAQVSDEQFDVGAGLTLEPHETVHANPRNADGTPVFTDEQIDAALPALGMVSFEVLPGESAELDCGTPQSRTDPTLGGLVYCSRGGTGRWLDPKATDESGFPRFPECCDGDGDGMGTLTPNQKSPDGRDHMELRHGATTAQIGSGDVAIARVVNGGVETQYPATLEYVFATVPALASFDDGVNGPMAVPYPIAGHQPGPPGPGTRENPLPVSAGAGGEVALTLTVWRPQRRSIAPEPGTWTDMGGLNYTAGIADAGLDCPLSTLSTGDPNLVLGTFPAPDPYQGLGDRASDQPADPAHTLTFTLNVSRCFAGHSRTVGPGETFGLAITGLAPSSGNGAIQQVFFRRT